MRWPVFIIDEVTRRRIAKASAILNIVGALSCLSVIIAGLYVLVCFRRMSHLMEGFDSNALPVFMIIVGCIGTLLSSVGIKLCWANHKPENRDELNAYLYGFVIIFLLFFLSVFICAIFCFAITGSLKNAFSTGIRTSMKLYATRKLKKADLDRLQIDYSCCGDKGYTDWFKVTWITITYLSARRQSYAKRQGSAHQYLNDDTPFSCCDPKVPRPCIHHHVHDNNAHYNYNFRTGTTLHKIGCTDALMLFYGKLLLDMGGAVMGISIMELIILIMMRITQTSIATSIENHDVEGPSRGFIFSFGDNIEDAEGKRALLDHSDDEHSEGSGSFDSEGGKMLAPNEYTIDPLAPNEFTIDPFPQPQFSEHIYDTVNYEAMDFEGLQPEPPADYGGYMGYQPEPAADYESYNPEFQYAPYNEQEPIYENVNPY